MKDPERYLVDRTGPPDPTVRRLERILAVKRYRPRRRLRVLPALTLLAATAAAGLLLAIGAVCPAGLETETAPPASVSPSSDDALAQEEPQPDVAPEPEAPVGDVAEPPAAEAAVAVETPLAEMDDGPVVGEAALMER